MGTDFLFGAMQVHTAFGMDDTHTQAGLVLQFNADNFTRHRGTPRLRGDSCESEALALETSRRRRKELAECGPTLKATCVAAKVSGFEDAVDCERHGRGVLLWIDVCEALEAASWPSIGTQEGAARPGCKRRPRCLLHVAVGTMPMVVFRKTMADSTRGDMRRLPTTQVHLHLTDAWPLVAFNF
ncbi:hypothetical protein AK812_SmicGene2586 [Symbiodinium microadriaticum]|uniref:Uncharacterized protein n=1 Tax=Symbiodinium microadriaticum TaxID=2951 RepID=A0A1Q9F153_SYMMI|nr:hypothetical protein AK812_SmicGene2586 [Symbiodinium microadriaticum]